MGDLITNGYLCKIKSWMLLIPFVTLEIQSVLEMVAILVLSWVRSEWDKFQELLPILTWRALSNTICGQVYSTYICPVLLYAIECWAPSVNDLLKPERNDYAMVQRICNMCLKDCQSVNQKIKIGAVRPQLGKRVLVCPNVAGWSGESGGCSEIPLPLQPNSCGAEPHTKTF